MQEMTKWLLVLIAVALLGLLIVAKKPEPAKAPRQASQEIWQGALDVGGIKLRLVLKISKSPDGTLKATLDSVDQGAMNLPVDSIVIENKIMRLVMKSIGGSYEGTLSEDGSEVIGTWTQSGQSLPLAFKRATETAQVLELKRPQEPKKPYPYREEEVIFANPSAAIQLAGTLTLPKEKGPFPAVVLISGSGQQDRDETVFGHRPFLVLADHLTRQGIAVLRYDDRGVGKSTGDPTRATSADFATDALAAVRYLQTRKEIDPKKIGLIGHSEGGLIAPLVAVQAPGEIAFIVLLAGPGVTGEELLLLQQELILRALGINEGIIAQNRGIQQRVFAVVREQPDNVKAEQKLRALLLEELSKLSEEEQKALGISEAFIEAQIKQMLSPWFRYFLTYDPRPTLMKVRCPVLALNGEKDLQVPPSQNLPEIVKALEAGGHSDYTVVKLANLNHLFQTSATGSPSEYAQIEETFSPRALRVISSWIVQHAGK
ncbi:MAG: alpha/beta fold hydrolase [Candidatus Bipolaricaulota bacterium]|nr:alpha/beta fold hydrolase [Candidatus Bipolaricaulota bacterium]